MATEESRCDHKRKVGQLHLKLNHVKVQPIEKIHPLPFLMRLILLLLLLMQAPPLSAQPHTSEVTILSVNAYSFPKNRANIVGFFYQDLHPRTELPVETRLRLLAEAIAGLPEPQPDIIAVQEAWGTNNKKRLIGHLSSYYPYFAYDQKAWGGKWSLGMGSGLLILSKIPITRDHSLRYAVEGVNEEAMAYKGALMAEFSDGNDGHFILANTHLQSGNSIEAIQVRQLQIDELGQTLDYFAGDQRRLIICGDFNSGISFNPNKGEWNTSEVRFITETLAQSGVDVSIQPVVDALPKQKWGSNWEGTSIIDHFFLSPQLEVSHYNIHRSFIGAGDTSPHDRETAVTDHAGVIIRANLL